jgi:PAS domain S-box-containing protein
VYANSALERLTGFYSDQVNQADWHSFLLQEDRAVASASWQRSLATEAAYRVHVRSQPIDRFRVRGLQLCWLLFLLVVTFNQWPLLFGQARPPARLHVDHNSWTFNQGTPADVSCLAQTNDGFLWLGGHNGLFRFDGTRFEPFRSPFGDRLLSTNLHSLFGPPSGGLWVGYQFGGFSFLNNGRVTNYGGETASSTGTVYGFAQDRDGIVWAATSSGLWRFDDLGGQPIGVEWNAPTGSATKVGFDPKGILWALAGISGAPMDLIYLLPGTRHFKTAERNLPVEGFMLDADRVVITDPAAPPMSDSSGGSEKRPAAYPVLTKGSLQFLDRNNSLWISPDNKPIVMRVPEERHRGVLNRASPAGSESYDINPFVTARLVDGEGNIWFGDSKGGIHRYSYSRLGRQEFPKEALGNTDLAVAADDNGTVWIISGTTGSLPTGNLYYVSNGKAQHRLPQVMPSVAYRAPDRTFWFSGERCLWHLVGHDFVRVNLPREIANQFHFLQTITQDEQGGIWVSFGRHGLYRLADGIWTPNGGRDDLPKTGMLIDEFTDSLGRVWFGYTKSQLAVLDGNRVRVFGPSDGLELGNITAIHGRGSKIWIGVEFGLEQFDQGRFRNLASVNDEWLRGISGIVETPNGDLWLNAISGIFHVRKAEIAAALRDSNYRVKGEHFGRREGLPGIPSQVRPLPTAIEGTDGRLWFTLRNGVVWLDPADYSEKKAASPPITIQSVVADDKSYAPASRLSLPAHTSSVQVSYSAVSLSDPEAVRFRYKLQETDKGWHEAAEATHVAYRNLPPGSYHFSVEASDTYGDWFGAPANLAFTIQPTFYQTVWFRSLGVFLFLAVLTGLFRLRLRHLERQRDALRKSEKELRDVIDPATLWSALPDGSNTYVSKRFVEYSGLSAEQTVGSGWQGAIHPDDLERQVGKWMEALATGKPLENEVRFRRSDGQYRWHLDRGVPLRDEAGNIVKWYGVVTDIEDRKRAEEALRSSEQRFRLIVDSIPGLVCAMSPTGEVQLLNRQVLEYFGKSPEQLKSWATSDAVHPDDLPRVIPAWVSSIETGHPYDIEHRCRRGDGVYRWFQVRALPVRDAEGRISGWYILLTDIDDRKRAEEALQQTQLYLVEGQRLAHMGSWAFNPSGFFDYWSQELFKIYGLDPQQGAPTLEQYLATVHPQDYDFMANTIKRMRAERRGCDVKSRIVRQDGEQRYIRFVGIPVVEGEALKGFLGTAIDVTEQELLNQELELRQAHLAEAQKLTHTGSWAYHVTDRNAMHSSAVQISEEVYRIYGFDQAEGAPTWEEYLERVHPEDRHKWKAITERVIMEKADYDQEYRILLPNGMVKWIHSVGHPVLSDTGDLEQFVGSSTDISELKSAEQEREKLRQLEADLAHTNRVSTLGEMAASLAHEIKRSSSPSLPPSPAPTAALNGWHTTRPILIGRVRQQPESIGMGIVQLRSSTVYVRSTRNLLHNVNWST